MKIVKNQNAEVSVFEDGVSTKDVISTLMQNLKDKDDPFYCVDIGDILLKHEKWQKLLPRIEPFYAIKCNTDPLILELMTKLGIGFDCASKVEIQTMLNYGITPNKIIFANACKQLSHLKYAVAHGIDLMTFDNEMELRKIKALAPNSRLLLRIITDDSKSLCQLSFKYGAALHQCQFLLKVAKDLELNVIGVRLHATTFGYTDVRLRLHAGVGHLFHVGSGCFDAAAFKTAVESARIVFDWAEDLGFDFSLLDVGGGFPGSASKDIVGFEEMCTVLNKTLDKCFPLTSGIRIIAEPGRYYVSSGFTLVTNVTSRRETNVKVPDPKANHIQPKTAKSFMYYINDGVYGSFNCLIFDHATVEAIPLRDHHGNDQKYPSSLWGPSCDSFDCVAKNVMLPECKVGEWLYFKEMGAYTLSAASGFNGFLPPSCYYYISLKNLAKLEESLGKIDDFLLALSLLDVKVKKYEEQYGSCFLNTVL